MVIRYEPPKHWILYDFKAVAAELVDAKVAVRTLTSMPYQRSWVEALQAIQLKREVAGTSRIEGADFTEQELETALKPNVTYDELLTHSQKQAHAAVQTYRWIAAVEDDRPVDADLVREVRARIVHGCDDDHCAPGELRGSGYNVTFGIPQHRGCEGGKACERAFDDLMYALQHEYRHHDSLIQALALHHHLAAMHPFMDGNGRTARAIEALLLQRAGLSDRAFIAMSNFYYDEKRSYLSTLAAVRATGYDLTPFLRFGLRGIALQCQRLYTEIRKHMDRALFTNMMYDLFNRLQGARKGVIAERQIAILKVLLDLPQIGLQSLMKRTEDYYGKVDATRAFLRDISGLLTLGALRCEKSDLQQYVFAVNLNWPREITETKFFETVKSMPKAKTYRFLS